MYLRKHNVDIIWVISKWSSIIIMSEEIIIVSYTMDEI